MATTSLELVIDREWGFCGSVILTTFFSGLLRSWKWTVQSHDADISSAGEERLVNCNRMAIIKGFKAYSAPCCIPRI